MKKLVIFPAIDDVRFERIQNLLEDLRATNCGDQEEAASEIADAHAFYGKITTELLQRAKRLEWIQCPTASLEHYIFPELIEHPAVLTNMRGLFSDVIADQVLGYIIMFARNLHLYRDAQREARWEPIGDASFATDFTGNPGTVTPIDHAHRHLADCSVGIVGVGSIGSEIARRASAFGMTVYGVDPQAKSVPGVIEEVWPPDRLGEMLAQVDFAVIAAPHTPQTEGLFDAKMIAKIQSTSYLINIGRGAIVKLDALTSALRNNQIAGSALDVFEIEPLPHNHPLWSMPNVIITPHVAAASMRVPERHLETLLVNILRFAIGETLLNICVKANWC